MKMEEHAIELAAALDSAGETILGPSDSELAALALRYYAEWLEANSP